MMSTGVFIRGVWGDDSSDRYRRIRNDIVQAAAADKQQGMSDQVLWFVFGRNNATLLRTLGVSASLLSVDSTMHWPKEGHHGHWRHKIEIIAAALRWNPQVIWLDGDTFPVKSPPASFWASLLEGSVFRSSLRQHRRVCNWRRRGKNRVPHGAMMYFRDSAFVDQILDVYDELPSETDEVVISKHIDNLHGGWIGDDTWATIYEPGWYDQGNESKQLIHTTGPVLFANQRR